MTVLEPVLSVRELPPSRARLRQHLPSLRALARSAASPEEAALLPYLSQGVVCGLDNDRGLAFDVLQPGVRLDEASQLDPRLSALAVQPGALLTDGAWVWSGVLPYYVAVYHLQLPARFLQYAQQRQWQIDPSAIKLDELNCDAYDGAAEGTATALSGIADRT